MKVIILLFAALCGVGYYFYQDFDHTRKEQEATIAELRRQLAAPAPVVEKKNWLQDRIANRVSPLEGSSYDRHVGVWSAPTVYPAGSSGSSAYYYDTTGRYWIDQYGRRQYTPSR